MIRLRHVPLTLAIIVLALGALDLAEHSTNTGKVALVATAEAVVGRPLTPVSVAGVARRSSRRCAAGVTC